jgi:hypothetical protein
MTRPKSGSANYLITGLIWSKPMSAATDSDIRIVDAPPAIVPDEKVNRNFRRSESIGALAAALAKAQGEIRNPMKDSANPYYNSHYADLAAVADACRSALSKNGLAVMQFPRTEPNAIEVETCLAHASGEWVAETLRLPAIMIDKQGRQRFDAQTCGSAITYARRYALASIVGVSPEDDDGNAATDSVANRTTAPASPPKILTYAEQQEVEKYVVLLETEATDVDTMNAAYRQLMQRNLPRGPFRQALWSSMVEHAKQQGWRWSPKQVKFLCGNAGDST